MSGSSREFPLRGALAKIQKRRSLLEREISVCKASTEASERGVSVAQEHIKFLNNKRILWNKRHGSPTIRSGAHLLQSRLYGRGLEQSLREAHEVLIDAQKEHEARKMELANKRQELGLVVEQISLLEQEEREWEIHRARSLREGREEELLELYVTKERES